MIRKSKFPGVYLHEKDIFTKNLVPGISVYGEKRVIQDNVEYRYWDPVRSKLSAMLHRGCKNFSFGTKSKVLYLGAASGTTVSHISDIVTEGIVYCVEISRQPFRKLLLLSTKRENIIPILADANLPEKYKLFVKSVDVVYQDIAQPNQHLIFLKNIDEFLNFGGYGILQIKSRSIDVTAKPKKIFKKIKTSLSERVEILESIDLHPFHRDHISIVVRAKK